MKTYIKNNWFRLAGFLIGGAIGLFTGTFLANTIIEHTPRAYWFPLTAIPCTICLILLIIIRKQDVKRVKY